MTPLDPSTAPEPGRERGSAAQQRPATSLEAQRKRCTKRKGQEQAGRGREPSTLPSLSGEDSNFFAACEVPLCRPHIQGFCCGFQKSFLDSNPSHSSNYLTTISKQLCLEKCPFLDKLLLQLSADMLHKPHLLSGIDREKTRGKRKKEPRAPALTGQAAGPKTLGEERKSNVHLPFMSPRPLSRAVQETSEWVSSFVSGFNMAPNDAGARQRKVAVAKVDSREDKLPEDELPAFTPPVFTVKDLLSAIPAHCFKRSALRSSAYLALDLVFVGALAYAASFIDSSFAGPTRWLAWSAYWFMQGMVCTGIWVIAHECQLSSALFVLSRSSDTSQTGGHQAFSSSKALNNAVGWVFHSALLVPYHSWRISHARHHAATGHMTRDQVFVPKTRTQRGLPPAHEEEKSESAFEKADKIFEDAPIWVLGNLALQQVGTVFIWTVVFLFWIAFLTISPVAAFWLSYVLVNQCIGPEVRPTDEPYAVFPPTCLCNSFFFLIPVLDFEPSSPIFDPRHRYQILWSDLGIILVLGVLTYMGRTFGFSEVVKCGTCLNLIIIIPHSAYTHVSQTTVFLIFGSTTGSSSLRTFSTRTPSCLTVRSFLLIQTTSPDTRKTTKTVRANGTSNAVLSVRSTVTSGAPLAPSFSTGSPKPTLLTIYHPRSLIVSVAY
jgi:fatty acid desaturase